MTLDPATGILTLASGTRLGPDLTRAGFLATPESQTAEAWAGPHYRFFTGGGLMGLVTYFYPPAWPERTTAGTDPLNSVGFWLAGPAYPSDWEEWTAQREQQQQADTATWLAAQGVILRPIGENQREAAFPWGKVGLYYDFKDGGFYNSLSYARP